jgi:hypothetical protein
LKPLTIKPEEKEEAEEEKDEGEEQSGMMELMVARQNVSIKMPNLSIKHDVNSLSRPMMLLILPLRPPPPSLPLDSLNAANPRLTVPQISPQWRKIAKPT